MKEVEVLTINNIDAKEKQHRCVGFLNRMRIKSKNKNIIFAVSGSILRHYFQ